MKILALSDVHGKMEMLRKVREAVPGAVDTIVFTGDIVKGKARGDEWLEAKAQGRQPHPHKRTIELEAEEDLSLYSEFFNLIRKWGVPTFFVPGNMDAPRQRYFESVLQSSADDDRIRCVHGLVAFLGDLLISGTGGEITEESREDFFVLQVPRWEAEYLMSFLRDFPDRKIFLFHTPPIGLLDMDKGQHKGSRVVNDLIEKHKPWLVFCGHAHNSRGTEQIGESVAINPGSLKAGYFAIVDSETREVEFRTLAG